MGPLYGHSQHPRSPSLLPPRVLATSPQPPSLSSPVLYLKSHLISLFYIGISYIFILTSPQFHVTVPQPSYITIPTRVLTRVQLESSPQPQASSSPTSNLYHHPNPALSSWKAETQLCPAIPRPVSRIGKTL